MLHIDREKFQLLPQGKILKRQEYSAFLEAVNAVQHAYRENDRLIQNASQLCEQLVQDTNGNVGKLVGDANAQAVQLIDEANERAAKIIQEANQKSEAILAEAEKMRSKIFEEAKKYYASEAKRGYDDGYSTGKKEMTEQLVEISARNSHNIEQLQGNIVMLVMKALKRILGEVQHDELIVALVRQALKAVKNQQEAIVKVSPEDSQAVRDQMKTILADGTVDFLEVVVDSRLTPGTCILETDVGVVDAGIETQLTAITEAFEKYQKTLKVGNQAKSDSTDNAKKESEDTKATAEQKFVKEESTEEKMEPVESLEESAKNVEENAPEGEVSEEALKEVDEEDEESDEEESLDEEDEA